MNSPYDNHKAQLTLSYQRLALKDPDNDNKFKRSLPDDDGSDDSDNLTRSSTKPGSPFMLLTEDQFPTKLSRVSSLKSDDARTIDGSSIEDRDRNRSRRRRSRRRTRSQSIDSSSSQQYGSEKNSRSDYQRRRFRRRTRSRRRRKESDSEYSSFSSSGSSSDDSESEKKEEGNGGGSRCPITHGILSNCVTPRYRRMKNPIFWFGANFVFTIFLVWLLAKRYTEQLCSRRTEFINAGRIYGEELNKDGWSPPDSVAHLVSSRRGKDNADFTFVSGHGNYDFMVKSNYKICSSAMPQLQCDCSSEVAGPGCEIMQKLGMGGFVIRDADYRSDPLSDGGPKPNNPCQNIFNDCVLDGFGCDNYYNVDDGCPIMPLGDIIGNHVIRDFDKMENKDWSKVGRCDERELCNGITGVQYLVCKTWKEAVPMALAWVAIIEVLVAVSSFFIFFVLLRYRDKNGKKKWRPCAPLTVADVKQMINVMVPDDNDRRALFEQARNSQVNMGLRDFGPSVPFVGKRDRDGRPADGFGRMSWPNGDVYEGEWKHGVMHGVGLFVFANGQLILSTIMRRCTYKGEMRNGLRNGIGCFTFSKRKFDYDWSAHLSKLGKGRVTAPTSNQIAAAQSAKRRSVNIPIDIVYERRRQNKSNRRKHRSSHKRRHIEFNEKDNKFFNSTEHNEFDVDNRATPISTSNIDYREGSLAQSEPKDYFDIVSMSQSKDGRRAKVYIEKVVCRTSHHNDGQVHGDEDDGQGRKRKKKGTSSSLVSAMDEANHGIDLEKGESTFNLEGNGTKQRMLNQTKKRSCLKAETNDNVNDVNDDEEQMRCLGVEGSSEDEEDSDNNGFNRILTSFYSHKQNKKGKRKLSRVCVIWKNGDSYIGKWKYVEGRPGDGYGIMQWANGDVYEGKFIKGHPVQGIPQWQSRYTGEFKNGQEDGLGRYVWRAEDGSNGNEWDGEWKQGEITYRGVYTRKLDGKMLFENKWEKGEKHEKRIGIVKWKGKEYNGEYCWDNEMESADHNDLFFSHSCSRSLGVCRNICYLIIVFGVIITIMGYFSSMSASSHGSVVEQDENRHYEKNTHQDDWIV